MKNRKRKVIQMEAHVLNPNNAAVPGKYAVLDCRRDVNIETPIIATAMDFSSAVAVAAAYAKRMGCDSLHLTF